MSANNPSRKRGAPYGNRNALKHGLYSRKFRKADSDELGEEISLGLENEINMLRSLITSAVSRKNEIEYIEDFFTLLRTISLASTSLTRLIKTQHWLSTNTDDTAAAINQALREVYEELRSNDTGQDPPDQQGTSLSSESAASLFDSPNPSTN